VKFEKQRAMQTLMAISLLALAGKISRQNFGGNNYIISKSLEADVALEL